MVHSFERKNMETFLIFVEKLRKLLFRPSYPLADLGFPRGGGAKPHGGGANLLFGQKFPENCMKMKEFGPTGGHASLAHPP